MREISESFAAHLATGETTLCHVWRLTLKDGREFGFTDHDQTLAFSGLNCTADSGFVPGESQTELGLAATTTVSLGVLDDGRISADDIRAGDYDQAKLELYRVNWQAPDQYVHLATGWLGDIQWRGHRFEAEWRGPAHALSRSTGRVFTRYCDAELGDTRCGLDKSVFPSGTSCARSFQACKTQFNNAVNFRGHPFLIGDDSLMATPRQGDLRDGGSRYGD